MFRILQSIVVVLSAAMLFGAESKIRWTDQYVEVQYTGQLPSKDFERVLSVRPDQSDPVTDLTLPSMAGAYEVEANTLRFTPRFPLEPNITYRATFRPAPGKAISATHRIEAKPSESTTVVRSIRPSASTLPENILKFYIHFSAPMSGGRIYDHITLRDSSGKSVELPFLEIDEELWNPDMTRLTLFLDPGRIKRGVKPLEDIGPSFHAGKTYTLTISDHWLDATGAKLKKGFEKKFSVTEADRDPPDPTQWKIEASKEEVTVTFGEPLDHAIIQRTIGVVDARGNRIRGRSELRDEERVWVFRPAKPWENGPFQVVIPTLIEDLAGNNIGKPFDVDLAQGERRITNDYIRLPFRAP